MGGVVRRKQLFCRVDLSGTECQSNQLVSVNTRNLFARKLLEQVPLHISFAIALLEAGKK